VIRVYDEAGNVIETHEHAGDFKSRKVHRQFFRISEGTRIFQIELFRAAHNQFSTFANGVIARH
jgi:hypothetical protein